MSAAALRTDARESARCSASRSSAMLMDCSACGHRTTTGLPEDGLLRQTRDCHRSCRRSLQTAGERASRLGWSSCGARHRGKCWSSRTLGAIALPSAACAIHLRKHCKGRAIIQVYPRWAQEEGSSWNHISKSPRTARPATRSFTSCLSDTILSILANRHPEYLQEHESGGPG